MSRLRKAIQGGRDAARRGVRRAVGVSKLLRFNVDAETSLAQAVQARAVRSPNHPALRYRTSDGRLAEMSYGTLDRLCAIRARKFADLGAEKDSVVALMMSNSPAFLVNALALIRLGAIPAMINTGLRGSGLGHAIRVGTPLFIVAEPAFAAEIGEALAEDGGGIPLWTCQTDPENHESLGSALAPTSSASHGVLKTTGADTCCYIYTSGTTGLPKAGRVLNARAAYAASGFGLAAAAIGPEDCVYCALPLFHSNGFLVAAASAFYGGGTLAIAKKLSVSRFWDDVADFDASCFVYIGEVCRYLLSSPPHPKETLHRLRVILGNGMREEVWRPFVERFQPGTVCEFYGATEGNVNMINPVGRVGSVGRLPPGRLNNCVLVRFDQSQEMPLRNAQGRCVKAKTGEVGELLGRINPDRVTQRFDGYVSSSATSKKILRDVFEPGDAYFRTGDLLRQDWLGFYYFVDRVGDTFRWKGENVSTNEVADAVGRLAGIETANVYGVEVPGCDGRAGMCALVMVADETFDPTSFYQHVTKNLPSYARPAFVRVVDGASLTATFKLKKVALQEEGYDLSRVGDPLFVRCDASQSYRPFDETLHAKVCDGSHKL